MRASVDAAGKLRFGGDAAFTQRLSTGHYRVAFRPQSDLNALNLDRCAVDGSHVRALKGGTTSAPRRSTARAPAPSTT